jgi:hypothetical protein
MPKDIY